MKCFNMSKNAKAALDFSRLLPKGRKNTKRKKSFSGFVEAPPFFERSSKNTRKLAPSVPGFASAKLGTNND